MRPVGQTGPSVAGGVLRGWRCSSKGPILLLSVLISSGFTFPP